MTTHTDLIAALHAATGPDRELDARIYAAVHGYAFIRFGDEGAVFDDGGKTVIVVPFLIPRFTGSLDVITALIDRGFPETYMAGGFEPGDAWFRIGYGKAGFDIATVTGKTEPLARCIAFLKAIETREQANG